MYRLWPGDTQFTATLPLCLLLLLSLASATTVGQQQKIDQNEVALRESDAAYAAQIAPINRSLNLNIKLLNGAKADKKAADAALKARQKNMPWYRHLVDDAETDKLQIEQGAAEMAIKAYTSKVNTLQGAIEYSLKEKRILDTALKLKITKADPAALDAEAKRRTASVEKLNSEYYTQAAQKTAGEVSFDQKLAVFDALIEQSSKADQDDVADAIASDRKIVADVKEQWLKGQDAELSRTRGQLDQAYDSNRKDGIGPDRWNSSKPANSAEFIDRESVQAAEKSANRVAGAALANTQQDMSVTAFVEDYGNSALIDPKTGEWDFYRTNAKTGELEWGGVALRYGAYAKGSGRAAKDSVVDLGVLAVTLTETAVQATQVAIDHHTGTKNTSQVNRDKINTVYRGANALGDLTDPDSVAARKRREQMLKTATGVMNAGDRKLEQLAGNGDKGVLDASEFFGYGFTAVVDPFFSSKAKAVDRAGDLGLLGKADSDGILKRLDTDALDARVKLNDLPGDKFVDGLKKNGLEPKRTVEIRGEKFHLSEPFEGPGGRTMVIALHEGANGKVVPRTFYLSGEHGVWRAAPAQMFGTSGTPLLNKGPARPETGKFVNEGVVDIDAALQGQLDNLTNEMGVKKLDGDAASQAALGHLELATPDRTPDSLKVDAAGATKPLPREANGNLPEGMRPDWANGQISSTVVENAQYGTVERFVYKSKDGTTDWIVNRAENGDVWVASMQDARAGITGQGTRSGAWQASDITSQPFTKDANGAYTGASDWKNPVNDYMARNLPGAPDAPPMRAPDAGLPTSARMARQTTGQGQTPAQRELAIKESNMVPSHAEAFSRIARERGEIVMIRPVNPHSTGKIAGDAATKGMNIKGKSTDWGADEILGLIPVDSRYSKLGNPDLKVATSADDFRKYSELNKKALGERYNTPKTGKDGKITWEPQDAVEPIAMEKTVLGKDGKPILGADGEPLKVLAERVPVLGPDGKQVIGPDGKPKFEAGNPITADYDLFAVGSREPKSTLIENDPEMGNISEREVDTMEALNKAVQRTGYKGGKVVHHGAANRFADFFEAADFPIAVALPNGDFINLFSANEVLIFYERMARAGYNLDSMPGWNFGITDPAKKVAKAREGTKKGEALRADASGQQAKEPGARPLTGTAGQKARIGAGKAANSGDDSEDEDVEIAIGFDAQLYKMVDPVYFSFGPYSWLEDIEDWIDPGESSLILLGNSVTFEIESAISVEGTNAHSSLAVAAQMLLDDRPATAPPPVRRDPPKAAPPVQEKPPLIVIGPPKPEPVKPKPVKKPPVVAPPVKKEEPKIRIGTTRGGARHKFNYSFSCFSIQLEGDTADADTAEVSVDGPGDDGYYKIGIGINARIDLEHKIYTYGTYNYEIEKITNKKGEDMQIIGSTTGSYKVDATEAPCF